MYAVTYSESGLFESIEDARRECAMIPATDSRIVRVADSLRYDPWLVRTESGEEIWALGYEQRGIWGVPVADCKDGECISVDVFKIIHGYVDESWNIGLTRPNRVELELLDRAGWVYDGAFAHIKEA